MLDARGHAHHYIRLGLGLKLLAPKQNGRPVIPELWEQAAAAGFSRRAHADRLNTRSSVVIDEVFDLVPDANIGINTGAASGGLVVLDIDPKNGGDESFRRLLDGLGPLPEVPTANTKSGGMHLFFSASNLPERRLKNLDRAGYPGIDVICSAFGKYQHVAAAPSTCQWLPKGASKMVTGAYGWHKPPLATSNLAVRLPTLPAGLVRLLAGPVANRRDASAAPSQERPASLEALVNFVRRTPEGQRNHMLFWAASEAARSIEKGAAYGAGEAYDALRAALYEIGCDCADEPALRPLLKLARR